MESGAYQYFDHLVIGSGLSGLTNALHLAESGKTVALITKRKMNECNSKYAQGGIACVMDLEDSFDEHVRDTCEAGAGLCNKDVVREIVEKGPEAVKKLIELGAHFTTREELGHKTGSKEFDLGKEGGHSKRRVLHSGDITGQEIENILIKACLKQSNIQVFEKHISVDLVTSWRLGWLGENYSLGAYILDIENDKVIQFVADTTTVACGGAGKVYLYTSNSDVASGDGIAMCYRANLPIANMEFFQFHPTILYHPDIKSFLISEAVRGEGAVLKRRHSSGKMIEFMHKYHKMKSLAPRDIVARAIDNELKMSGQECVYLDITQKSESFLKKRFPNIFETCQKAGINMADDMIPVVPAAHYCCGGVKIDTKGFTGVNGLYVIGENACTGLHGANRLASNSLLEGLVLGKSAAIDAIEKNDKVKAMRPSGRIPQWVCGDAVDSDELVVITHNWDEIRHFMWDYVGIVRTNKRLERAKTRIKNIRNEINKYYWDFYITPDLIELRNIASVAEIIIDSALDREESRGLHYNSDYPENNPQKINAETLIKKPHIS